MTRGALASFGILLTGGIAYAEVPVFSEGEIRSIEAAAGISLGVGGGISGFTTETMRDTTDTGGTWTARLVFGTASPVAVEGAYVGSAQSIHALGLDSNAILVGNGAQGDVRLNALPGYIVNPFIYGGFAWRHYSLVNASTNTSDIADHDDVIEYPVGIGLEGRFDRVIVDVRGEYRFALGADLVPSGPTADREVTDMNAWGVTLAVGYEL